MLIVDILSIQNCNYCIVGFALILILTTDVEILSRANVSAVLLTLGQPACTYSRTCVDVRTYVCYKGETIMHSWFIPHATILPEKH